MNTIPIVGERLDWSSAIGLFLINYGTLDYLVFVFLKDHLSSEEFARLQNEGIKNRVTKIAQHLLESNYPDAEQTAFRQWTDRFETVRELRNHLAHGHIYCRVDPKTQQPTVTVLKARDLDTGWLPDSKHVEFAELQAGLKELDELIKQFQAIAGFKPAIASEVPQETVVAPQKSLQAAPFPHPRDPLHGVSLESIVNQLVQRHGWSEMGRRIPVRCFQFNPTVKSSLTFLRKTPWARQKLEAWYISEL